DSVETSTEAWVLAMLSVVTDFAKRTCLVVVEGDFCWAPKVALSITEGDGDTLMNTGNEAIVGRVTEERKGGLAFFWKLEQQPGGAMQAITLHHAQVTTIHQRNKIDDSCRTYRRDAS
ncbi:hypothetical protein FOZ63_002057, partial [Perkinsus olseni]